TQSMIRLLSARTQRTQTSPCHLEGSNFQVAVPPGLYPSSWRRVVRLTGLANWQSLGEVMICSRCYSRCYVRTFADRACRHYWPEALELVRLYAACGRGR